MSGFFSAPTRRRVAYRLVWWCALGVELLLFLVASPHRAPAAPATLRPPIASGTSRTIAPDADHAAARPSTAVLGPVVVHAGALTRVVAPVAVGSAFFGAAAAEVRVLTGWLMALAVVIPDDPALTAVCCDGCGAVLDQEIVGWARVGARPVGVLRVERLAGHFTDAAQHAIQVFVCIDDSGLTAADGGRAVYRQRPTTYRIGMIDIPAAAGWPAVDDYADQSDPAHFSPP